MLALIARHVLRLLDQVHYWIEPVQVRIEPPPEIRPFIRFGHTGETEEDTAHARN